MVLRLALVAAALLAVAAGGASAPPTVVHRTAWLHGERPARGLYVSDKYKGRCTARARSTPRAYAWRCFAGRRFLDPCFSATPRSTRVICPASPWSSSVRIVRLTRPLPRWAARSERRSAPWGVWTTNAKRCVLAVSGVTLWYGGKRVRYECGGSGFLVGYADVGREWSIGYVPRYDLANPNLHPRHIGITDVWR